MRLVVSPVGVAVPLRLARTVPTGAGAVVAAVATGCAGGVRPHRHQAAPAPIPATRTTTSAATTIRRLRRSDGARSGSCGSSGRAAAGRSGRTTVSSVGSPRSGRTSSAAPDSSESGPSPSSPSSSSSPVLPLFPAPDCAPGPPAPGAGSAPASSCAAPGRSRTMVGRCVSSMPPGPGSAGRSTGSPSRTGPRSRRRRAASPAEGRCSGDLARRSSRTAHSGEGRSSLGGEELRCRWATVKSVPEPAKGVRPARSS